MDGNAISRSMTENQTSKILLVEDNKIARKVLENELSLVDADILTAKSGGEAVALAERVKPELIVMETELPSMSGFEICKKLKDNKNTRNIPVAFITQMESEEERQKAYSAGGVYYSPTNFPRGEFAKKMQILLDRNDNVPPQKVLIAEDSDTIRTIIANILKKQGHQVIEARDGLEAWEIMQDNRDIELLITDINMPRMDGSHLVRLVRGAQEWEFVPIIVASTLADKQSISELLNAGADDYLIKPFATEEFQARVKAHARVRHLYEELKKANNKLQNFNESLEKMVAFRTEELFQANMESIMMLAVASEYRDTDTGNHVRRIREFTHEITLYMGYSESKAEEIAYSSILHDVGKIAIPDSILKKPGKLDEEEFELMKTHTIHGESILSSENFFKAGREIARWHHEKFNGKGYPDGLMEYEIPLAARITSVADVFDALTNKRVYKEGWPVKKAYELIMDQAGQDFDPLVVDAFDKIYRSGRIEEIRKRFK